MQAFGETKCKEEAEAQRQKAAEEAAKAQRREEQRKQAPRRNNTEAEGLSNLSVEIQCHITYSCYLAECTRSISKKYS
jgi:hypothetical protein